LENALKGGVDPYSQPPKNKHSKVKGKKKPGQDDEEEIDDDVQYLNMRDLRKQKPVPTQQSQKEIPLEVLEKRKK
jgi:hypothetical protein